MLTPDLCEGRGQPSPKQPQAALEAGVLRAVTGPSLLTVDLSLVSPV